MSNTVFRQDYLSFPNKQRQHGVVLLISLIVLVAMTLAAVGMVRSVDTAGIVAGNLGFKQATLHSADQGIQAGYNWLVANAGGTTLNNTDLAVGYYSSSSTAPVDWSDPNTWTDEEQINGGATDASGSIVSYVIHRLCSEPDTPYNGVGATGNPNNCALSQSTTAATSGGSMAVGSATFTPPPSSYYRITARARGPRNTVSIIQTFVAMSN